MTKAYVKIFYVLVFIFTFFVFLLFTFPFEILKETVSKKLSEVSGMSISMESLEPNLPIGVSVEKLQVVTTHGAKLAFEEIDFEVGILPLFVGDISLSLTINNGKKGDLEVEASIPFMGVIGGQPFPSYVALNSQKFSFTELVSFALNSYANSPTVNPLLGPMLSQLELKGALDSNVSIELDADDPKNSDGKANIQFRGMSFVSKDAALDLPEQKFKVAQLVANMSGGKFEFDPKSKLQSDQLGLGISGSILFKNPIDRSELNLNVPLNMSGKIKENFGSLLEMLVLKVDSWDGNASFQIEGKLMSPKWQPVL